MYKLREISSKILFIVGALAALFHIVALIFYPLSASSFRSIHLLLMLSIVYLRNPFAKKSGKGNIHADNYLFLGLSIMTAMYAFFEIENISRRAGIRTTTGDIVLGIICTICVLEAARRTTGLALPIIAMAFIAYAVFGHHIPGTLGHRAYSIKRLVTTLYTYDGIFGTAMSTAATYVVIFVVFAAFLERTGCGDAFFKIATGISGNKRGGPAKVSTISSALFGSISGSAVANVAATGAFTIPLMKKIGYEEDFAGAVEAAASTGGQIMPPVMAAGAFLMAEFLGVKYTTVSISALIPALLYFICIWVSIDSYSGRKQLRGMDKSELPNIVQVLKEDWLVLMPLVLLVVLLMVFGFSAIRCAFYAIVASIVVTWFYKDRRMNLKDIVTTLSRGGVDAASTACSCACAGIVIGIINMTGLGLKISSFIISFSGNSLFLALLLSMLTALIFGMGLPTTVSYLLCVSILSPALIDLGALPIAAHLFIFYFACLSGITPPVALAAYTAAGISGGKPIATGFQAVKLAIVAFVIPYMFVYNTAYIANGTGVEIALAITVGICVVFALAGSVYGFLIRRLNWYHRIGLAVSALFLIYPVQKYDLIGLALFVMMILIIVIQSKCEKKSAPSASAE